MRTTKSKKSRLMGAEKVDSSDLLIAIFVLLPLKSLLRCRCVSKRWNNIIGDPYFLERYSITTRNDQLCGGKRLLAFVQDRTHSLGPYPHQFTNILPVAKPNKHKLKQLPNKSGSFVHCADGLILCHKYGSYYGVFNPLNSTWVKLPSLKSGILGHEGLVCEENTEKLVPSFKVVGVVMDHINQVPNVLFIQTYSSKTRKWKMSKLVAAEDLNVYFIKKTFVYNGVFHWYYKLSGTRRLLVYDSNAEENYVQMMNLPFDPDYNFSLTRSLCEDVLWIGMSDSRFIRFWMLPRDENGGYKIKATITANEWILMHAIDNVSLSKEMMILLESNGRKKSKAKAKADAESFLILEALIPPHPLVAVLSMEQNVFLYNLETKSTELVKYRGRSLAESTISGWIPFVGSPYLSTYGSFPKAY